MLSVVTNGGTTETGSLMDDTVRNGTLFENGHVVERPED